VSGVVVVVVVVVVVAADADAAMALSLSLSPRVPSFSLPADPTRLEEARSRAKESTEG
jgi:hypothetical protein